MAKKKPAASVPVDALKHPTDKRPNIPTRETAAFAAEDGPQPFVVHRDRSLDPQLVWKGKDEQGPNPLEVPAVPIHVQEKVQPDPAKCHFNLVPQDSDWETIVCQKLEEMDEVRAYAKNQAVGFRIPYTCDGRPGNYHPDLVVRIDDGCGTQDLLNLVLEVSGQRKKEKEAKVRTARTM